MWRSLGATLATLVVGLFSLAPSAEDLPPYKRRLGGEDAQKAAELRKERDRLADADNYAGAAAAAEKYYELRRRVQGSDHHEVQSAQLNSLFLREVAELSAANIARYRRASAQSAEAARMHQRGLYQEAERGARSVLEEIQSLFGPRHLETAQCLSYVGVTLIEQGKHAEGEAYLRTSLEIMLAKRGDQQPGAALYLTRLAGCLALQGRHAEAEAIGRRAAIINEQQLGPKDLPTLEALSALAGHLSEQGRHAESEELLRRAYEDSTSQFGADHQLTAKLRNNLAVELSEMQREEEAAPLYEANARLCERLFGKEHMLTAIAGHNFCKCRCKQGRVHEAEALCRQASEVARKQLGDASPYSLKMTQALGEILEYQGQLAQAEAQYRSALEKARRVLGEQHNDTVFYWRNLADVLRKQQKQSDALDTYADATKNYEAVRQAVSTIGLHRAHYSARSSPLLGYAACLVRAGKSAEAWSRFEQHFARGLLDDLRASQFSQGTAEQQARRQVLTDELSALREQASRLLTRPQAASADRAPLEKLTARQKQVQDELLGMAALQAVASVRSLAQVQETMRADEVVLAWLDLPAAGEGVGRLGEHWACMVRKSGMPQWVELPGSGAGGAWTPADESLPGRFRVALARKSDDAEALRRALAKQRVMPVAQHLESAGRVVVLPAGVMAGVPIETLVGDQMVSYAPSLTVLSRARERPRRAAPPRSLLAVADPTFAPADQDKVLASSALVRGTAWRALPGSRSEVRALAALFARSELLVGAEAQESRLHELARAGKLMEYDVLHFATHGTVDRQEAARCALILAQNHPAARPSVAGANPAFLDGRLEAGEILRGWDLNADLVTLSACETGLGQDSGGEGMMGFSQVLLLKGARSLLLSQWQVSDAATALLMIRFYENWLGRDSAGGARPRLSKAEALKEAKHWLRNLSRAEVETRIANLPEAARGLKFEHPAATIPAAPEQKPFAHPYYWSAFILVGDPE